MISKWTDDELKTIADFEDQIDRMSNLNLYLQILCLLAKLDSNEINYNSLELYLYKIADKKMRERLS